MSQIPEITPTDTVSIPLAMEARRASRDPWAWIGLSSAIAFTVLATLVARRGGLAFDEPLATAIRSLPIPVGIWLLITALGGGFLAAVGTAFVLGALLSRRLRLALIVASVLITASLFTHFVKDFVARPRPPWEHFAPAPGYSFPSGHTLNSTVSYGLLAVVVCRSGVRRAVRRLAIAVGLAVPFLIGISRIALGVHYPTDVFGGWLAGVAFVALGAMLIRLSGAMEDRHEPGLALPPNGTGPIRPRG